MSAISQLWPSPTHVQDCREAIDLASTTAKIPRLKSEAKSILKKYPGGKQYESVSTDDSEGRWSDDALALVDEVQERLGGMPLISFIWQNKFVTFRYLACLPPRLIPSSSYRI